MRRWLPILFSLSLLETTAQSDSSLAPVTLTIPGSTLEYKMVAIPRGAFAMGSPATQKGRKADEGPSKSISISPFWMGAYEVTHDQFGIFFKDDGLSQGSKTDAVTRPTPQYIDLSWNMGKEGGFPVNSMSIDAALMFCRWLYNQTGVFYRLPTEAEWEYACRAGSKSIYFFGDDPAKLGEYAWFKTNANNKYQMVGQKKPNAWGLYDMLGNVSEWVMDQYDEKYFNTVDVKDPLVPPSSRYPRSVRGGSYLGSATELRSAARAHSEPEWNRRDPQIPKSRWWLTDGMFVGFRIVRPVEQPTKEAAEKFYAQYLGN
ncbi:MAG: formylglycine-generating enzyme family protein [Sphingobacteriales bacterium]|nr:MAG: formylglycine-generating enzyme family protein [Sphingobacteriales bacterium]